MSVSELMSLVLCLGARARASLLVVLAGRVCQATRSAVAASYRHNACMRPWDLPSVKCMRRWLSTPVPPYAVIVGGGTLASTVPPQRQLAVGYAIWHTSF